jgi:prolyl-tRNA editing enzyme YbaK/EbsC (Cys-tRNA(Pro) deacylase)
MACDPSLADTAAFCEAYGFSLGQSANAILVAGKADPKKYACCIVLATTRLDVNKAVVRQMGVKKASFANADDTQRITGMQIGGVTLFGLPTDIPIYVDAAVMDQPEVVMGGGNRSSKVILNPQELVKLPGVVVVAGLAIPAQA